MNALLEITIYSGIIFACLLLFKRLFHNRLSPSLHLALWLLLVARLLIPVTFETPLHFVQFPANEAPADTPVSTNQETASPAHVTENARPAQEGSNLPIPQRTVPVPPARISSQPLTSAQWTTLIWATGALACLALTMRSYYTVRKSMLARSLCAPDRLIRMTEACRAELGIDRFIPVVVVRDIQSPALLFPHTILIPEQVLDMHDEEIYMALRHELTHLQRKDHYKALGLALLRIIHWFNPFVWMAVPLIREDMETACDAQVTKGWGKAKVITYAASILRMFGPLPTPRTSLAMASGTSRKSAEHRIRGIYMKKKSHRTAKGCAVVLAGALAVCCFTTACQPTPAAEAVVNQRSGISSNALKDTLSPDTSTTAGNASYSVSEHWTETVTPENGLTLTAEADVLTPDTDAFPVNKIESRDLPQDMVDTLVAKFVPQDAPVYQMPLTPTKSQYEEQLLDMRERLSEAEANNEPEEEVQAARESIAELEELYAQAPEENTMQQANFSYTYDRDYETGAENTDLGQNYINVAGTDASGVNFLVTACRTKDSVGREASFEFTQGGYQTESQVRESLADLQFMKDTGNEKAAGDDAYIEMLNNELARFSQNTMNLDEAKAQALELTTSLGIPDMVVLDAQRALFAPDTAPLGEGMAFMNDEGNGYNENAVLVDLVHANGGIPCVTLRGGSYSDEALATAYSAPFSPETVTVLIAEDGSIKEFMWYGPSSVAETVAADSELLTFSEAKARLTDQLAYLYLPWLDFDGSKYEIDLDNARLVMSYVNAENEPDKVLAVPAWYVSGTVTETSENGDKYQSPAEMMVSALDGSPILSPGTIQTIQEEKG